MGDLKEINFGDVFFGSIIGAILMFIVFSLTSETHKTIVKHGCAEYNLQTGNFQWIDENKNSKKKK